MIVQRLTIVPKSGQKENYLKFARRYVAQGPKVSTRWYDPISGRRDLVAVELEFADWAAREKWWKDWSAYLQTIPAEE